MDKLRKSIEALIFRGLKPVDPLYLTNRTWKQKLRTWVLIIVPCLLLVGFLALVLNGNFRAKTTEFPKDPPPAQVAAKMLPAINNLSIPANRDLDVIDIHITHDGTTKVAGRVKNNTDNVITSAEVIFDLTDVRGSRMGAVSAKIKSVDPHDSASFEFPIAQQTAVAAVVREIHTQ